MKKLLVYLVATMFMAASAYAEKRLGVSLAYTMFDSSGTEETKSSGEKNNTTIFSIRVHGWITSLLSTNCVYISVEWGEVGCCCVSVYRNWFC